MNLKEEEVEELKRVNEFSSYKKNPVEFTFSRDYKFIDLRLRPLQLL